MSVDALKLFILAKKQLQFPKAYTITNTIGYPVNSKVIAVRCSYHMLILTKNDITIPSFKTTLKISVFNTSFLHQNLIWF